MSCCGFFFTTNRTLNTRIARWESADVGEIHGIGLRIQCTSSIAVRIYIGQWRGLRTTKYAATHYGLETEFGEVTLF